MRRTVLPPDEFRERFNSELARFVKHHAREPAVNDRAVRRLLQRTENILLAPGKRIRPYLAYAAGSSAGCLPEEALKLGIALEVFHGYAIVHDDVIDRSDKRRGLPTLERQFAIEHQKERWRGDAEHFGDALAILGGDLLMTWSDLALRYVGTGKKQQRLERIWDDMKEEVILGQALDVSIGANARRPSRRNLMHMLAVKSGRYTIGRPMLLGYALSHAEVREETVMDIAEPLGIAFQIQDDVLSSFSNERTVGKSVNADMKEGKMTLMAYETMRRLDKEQERIWEKGFGRPSASIPDIQKAKSLMESSGAREYVETLASQLIDLSKERAVKLPGGGAWFIAFAEWMRERRS